MKLIGDHYLAIVNAHLLACFPVFLCVINLHHSQKNTFLNLKKYFFGCGLNLRHCQKNKIFTHVKCRHGNPHPNHRRRRRRMRRKPLSCLFSCIIQRKMERTLTLNLCKNSISLRSTLLDRIRCILTYITFLNGLI